jgi:hypothetical protein
MFRRKGDVDVHEEELVSLVEGRRASSASPKASSIVQLKLAVKGMHCSSCSSAVENALK